MTKALVWLFGTKSSTFCKQINLLFRKQNTSMMHHRNVKGMFWIDGPEQNYVYFKFLLELGIVLCWAIKMPFDNVKLRVCKLVITKFKRACHSCDLCFHCLIRTLTAVVTCIMCLALTIVLQLRTWLDVWFDIDMVQ